MSQGRSAILELNQITKAFGGVEAGGAAPRPRLGLRSLDSRYPLPSGPRPLKVSFFSSLLFFNFGVILFVYYFKNHVPSCFWQF